MAAITLLPGIATISGRMGDHVFKTYHRNGQTFVRMMPYCKPKRTTPLTDNEKKNNNLFGRIAKEVSQRIAHGDNRPRNIIWHEVKQRINETEQ